MLRDEQIGSGFWRNHLWLPIQEACNKQDSNRTEMKELKVRVRTGRKGEELVQVRAAQLWIQSHIAERLVYPRPFAGPWVF